MAVKVNSKDGSARAGKKLRNQLDLRNACKFELLEGRTLMSASLVAPSALTAIASAPATIKLNWKDNASAGTGYSVLRSSDGTHYALLAKIGSQTAVSYNDATALSGHSYEYEIEATSSMTTSAVSNVATVATPLGAPTGLTAQISGTSVNLNWTDNDPNATGYYVFRSQNNINFNLVATLTGTSINSFSQPFPAHGKTFYYRIQAFNTVATSAASASATVTTPLSAPTGLTAQISGTSVDLNWTDNDPNATGYYVFRSQDNINFNLVATLTGVSINSFSQPFPAHGKTFYYRIQAFNTVATSAPSASATVTTPLSAPTGLTAQISGTSVDLNWTDNDPNATGYYVFRSQDNINFNLVATLTGASINSFSQPFPADGITFYYRIQAFNTVATSAPSASATVTTPLSAPTGLTAQISGTSVDLNWSDNDSSATEYKILRSTNGGNFTLFSTLSGGSNNSFIDSSVQSDCTYSYEVEAATNSDASYNSNVATVTTNPAAPTNLTVTNITSSSITLAWTDSDPQITGDVILRSTDGTHFSQDAMITIAGATSFTDIGLSAHTKYYYEVEATNATATSAVSNVYAAETAMTAPLNVFAAAGGPTTVNLTWSDSDPGVSGFYILRSTDSVHFTQVGQVSGTMSFCDTSASSDTSYQYEAQAFADISSPVSAAASVSTPIIAPSGLVAVAKNGAVQLNWANNDSSVTGYEVLRSTDGTHFAELIQLTSGSAITYTDSTASGGVTYYYEVIATRGSTASVASNVATVTTPNSGNTGTVTLATRFSSELVITANGPDDSISVSESGSNLSIDADGTVYIDAAPADGLFIYTRGGDDTVSVDNTVNIQATVETIDGALTTISSGDAGLNAWIDSSDIFTGSGIVHRVASFAGGVTKSLGASLANPSDATHTMTLNDSLFGSGPVVGDVNQGGVGDCYFLSSLAAFANSSPAVLTNSVVDMGDGTYTVQFMTGSTPTFVRVNNQFATGSYGGGLEYAHMGSSDTIWAMVMEKAFAYFRTGANTYSSIGSGWMSEAYSDLGVSSTFAFPSYSSDADFFSQVSTALADDEAVTMGTISSPPNLVGDHAYTVISAYRDANGVAHYVVRNPWGFSGDSSENAQGYATLTFAQMQVNFSGGTVATS